jgi:hypothetical protein
MYCAASGYRDVPTRRRRFETYDKQTGAPTAITGAMTGEYCRGFKIPCAGSDLVAIDRAQCHDEQRRRAAVLAIYLPAGIPFTTAPGPIPFSANQPLRISSA